MCDQQSIRSACAYAQSDQSLCLSLEYSLSVKLLTEHHLEFLSFKGGCTGLSESIHVKMPHCWKSHVTAHNVKVRQFSTEYTINAFHKHAYSIKEKSICDPSREKGRVGCHIVKFTFSAF